jgi:magnesium chelatase family protein
VGAEVHQAVDMRAIKGQEHVKRALEVAASGGHNCLMTGTPGAGKTLLARCVPTILPSMSGEPEVGYVQVLPTQAMGSHKETL